jgi:ribonuclease HI
MEPTSYNEGPVIDTPWQVYFDGAWGASGARAPAILILPSGTKLRYTAFLQFTAEIGKCSNNIAEYKAVLLGLRKLRGMGVQNCILKINSKVLVSQIEKECMARDATLERYLPSSRGWRTTSRGSQSSMSKGQKTQKQMSWPRQPPEK